MRNMDLFMEYIVKHKRSGQDTLKIVGIIAAAVVLAAVSSLMLAFPLVQSLWLLVIVGIIYGAFFLIKRTNVEFEYIMTNNELDIDKIMAKSSRKRLVTVDFKEIDIMAKVDDAEHKSEYNSIDSSTKVLDCTGDGMTDIYFVDLSNGDGKVRVLFQPPMKLLEAAKKYNPRKIFI